MGYRAAWSDEVRIDEVQARSDDLVLLDKYSVPFTFFIIVVSYQLYLTLSMSSVFDQILGLRREADVEGLN